MFTNTLVDVDDDDDVVCCDPLIKVWLLLLLLMFPLVISVISCPYVVSEAVVDVSYEKAVAANGSNCCCCCCCIGRD
jgi:hypothetical protein